MKTIHLIRHAKSDWNHPSLPDVERPINERGQAACQLMAGPIVRAGCDFEHVFCSVATRAQQTIQGISQSLPGTEIHWKLEDALYTFSSHNLLSWCKEIDETLDEVMIVGHNPALTEFCSAVGDRYIENLPTCAYVKLKFPLDLWNDLAPASGKLVTLLTPKLVS